MEASNASDLDLFIVSKAKSENNISRLDAIRVKAELINKTKELGFPEFDGDGKYLENYSLDDFIKNLGSQDDDSKNTLTGRLLLFLESKSLIGSVVYSEIIDDVVAAYWRDYESHKNNFMPAFLANDILRLWRTFCVNYEAQTEREPSEKKLKRKVKNYKLKHSRMLTCYSALLYLLAMHVEKKTVHPEDAVSMTKLTPTERLAWLVENGKIPNAVASARQLLEMYERFLFNTREGDESLKEKFQDPQYSTSLIRESYDFGDLMFQVLLAVGKDNNFFRLLVV